MMAQQIEEIKAGDFDASIAQGTVLVDFWAPWCAPCLMQAPILEQVAQRMSDKVRVMKLNVEEDPSVADRYGIFSIPTMIIFKDGKPQRQLVGLHPAETLIDEIEKIAL